jgi:hypothetical protein
VDIETTLELISYMSKEIDIAVWLGVYPLIDRLEKKICTTEYYETLKAGLHYESQVLIRMNVVLAYILHS